MTVSSLLTRFLRLLVTALTLHGTTSARGPPPKHGRQPPPQGLSTLVGAPRVWSWVANRHSYVGSPHFVPEQAPHTQDQAGDHGEDYRHQQVDEEGEEAGEGEGGHHEDQDHHVRAEPRQEEVSAVLDGSGDEEEGEGEVCEPREQDRAQERLMVPVQPGHPPPHHPGHLRGGRYILGTGASTKLVNRGAFTAEENGRVNQ